VQTTSDSRRQRQLTAGWLCWLDYVNRRQQQQQQLEEVRWEWCLVAESPSNRRCMTHSSLLMPTAKMSRKHALTISAEV
jgi:hypothetical protein